MTHTPPVTYSPATARLADLKPYDKNPRTVSPKQLQNLRNSIADNGYSAPIIVDTDMTIVAGHQRHAALLLLGYDEVTVMVPSRKLTEEEFRRANILDNVPAGRWDEEMLKLTHSMESLKGMGAGDLLSVFKKAEGKKVSFTAKPKEPIKCPHCGEMID